MLWSRQCPAIDVADIAAVIVKARKPWSSAEKQKGSAL
jgi:hypothetical protein